MVGLAALSLLYGRTSSRRGAQAHTLGWYDGRIITAPVAPSCASPRSTPAPAPPPSYGTPRAQAAASERAPSQWARSGGSSGEEEAWRARRGEEDTGGSGCALRFLVTRPQNWYCRRLAIGRPARVTKSSMHFCTTLAPCASCCVRVWLRGQ